MEQCFDVPEESECSRLLTVVWLLVNARLKSREVQLAEKHNACVKLTTFEIGDKVLEKSHALSSAENHSSKKFSLLYEVRFVVIRIAGPNNSIVTRWFPKLYGANAFK